MFNKQNFCHVASNNRNEKKAGIFIYKTTDDLSTVSVPGYFNDKIIDLNLHDLIIHLKTNPANKRDVQKNVLCVTERTLDNVGTTVVLSEWQHDIEMLIAYLNQRIDMVLEYAEQTYVKKDGSSIMTGPLKFRAGSFEGAIAGGLGDGISIYKMKADGSIDSEVASLTKTNGFVPGTNNAMDIGRNNLKWKDAYIARVITAVLNNGGDIAIPNDTGTMALTKDIAIKSSEAEITSLANGDFLMFNGSKWVNTPTTQANTDLSNLTATGKNISNWSSNVSNCITEIPQDIKLEISNGSLTIKAGSKLYQPNGSGIFTPITLTEDKTRSDFSAWTSGIYMVFRSAGQYSASGGITAAIPANCVSGATDPSTSGMHFWYDTTNNKIKIYQSGSYQYDDLSLPIAIITVVNGTGVTSIDQIFNGIGFMGSHIFRLPNYAGLAPNGHNDDGTYKSTAWKLTSVLVGQAGSGTGTYKLLAGSGGHRNQSTASWFIQTTQPTVTETYNAWYDTDDNIIYYTNDTGSTWTSQAVTVLGTYHVTNGKIDSFEPVEVFRAADVANTMTTDSPQIITAIKSLQAANDDEWQIKKIFADNTAATESVRRQGSFRVRDKNSLIMGDLRVVRDTDGSVTTSMVARNKATGSEVTGTIYCSVSAAGVVKTYAPALATANSILTTVSSTKSSSGYFKLGNGLIIQWMCGISPTSDTAYSLPTAFTSGSSYSTVVVHATSGDDAFVTTPYSQTSTTVKFHRGGGIGSPYNVICIGY